MRNVKLNRSVLVLALLLAAAPGLGATFTVTNLTDGAAPGPAGSLRAAVTTANATAGADTIDFQAGLTGTITLTSGQLFVSDSVTVTGPGATLLTVSGNNASRVFEISSLATVTISSLTIADGNEQNEAGGILNHGALTLISCAVQNNTAGFAGGGIESGAGSLLTVSHSLLTGNQAILGAAIYYISVNQAVLTNVTVSGNTCTGFDTGAVQTGGGGRIRLESCTVTANTSGNGNSGGLGTYGSGSAVEYRNTIVSANTHAQFVANSGGTLTSLGHNISSDGTGNLSATGDQPNTNPSLGALADNGGPTKTHALLAGSPAIDAGDPVTYPSSDQRGAPRPSSAACGGASIADIGAYELQTVYNVTTPANSGAGSLRQAVLNNNIGGGGTICISVTGTIVLTGGQLTLTKPVNIIGPGANLLTVRANGNGRVFEIGSGTVVAISGLTIANGVLISGNGGGILNNGDLTLTACTVRNSSADAGQGGGIWSGSESHLSLNNVLLACNDAPQGAALEHLSSNEAVLTNVTVSRNGGFPPERGGIRASAGGRIRLNSCTVVDNSGGVIADGNGSEVRYRNTIVGQNFGQQFSASNGGTLTSLGYNLSTDGTGNLTATGDKPNSSLFISPLADNGGPTQTHALLPLSAPLDAGDPVNFEATDQRGAPRPGAAGCGGSAVPDIGAFEAQRYSVTNLNDSGTGSLRQAILDNNANPGAGDICFSIFGTVLLTSGQLTLTNSVNINVPIGGNPFIVSGNNASRVLQVNAGVTATVVGLTITDGRVVGESGAGILNQGKLSLTQCAVRNSTAVAKDGGGIWSGPGSSLTISESLLAGNQATFAAALSYQSGTSAELTNVTVSGNTCTGTDTGPVEAVSAGRIRLECCTITSNTSGGGNSGGVSAYNGGAVQYRNTIVSGNSVQQFVANLGGTLTSLGWNISSDGTGNLTAFGDQPSTDPLLGPLADNGGSTLTHALLGNSPAIDAGIPFNAPTIDQRSVFRLGLCTPSVLPDIGAFEVEAYTGDDDGDGVIDPCDACPGTPSGETVDPSGCVIPGDFDHDGDVDTDDVDAFKACASRDAVPRPPGCETKDFDNDNDCDMNDFAVVQRCYSGPDVAGDPNCAQ